MPEVSFSPILVCMLQHHKMLWSQMQTTTTPRIVCNNELHIFSYVKNKGIHCCKQSNVLKKINLFFNKEGYLYIATYLLSKFIHIHAKIHLQTCKANANNFLICNKLILNLLLQLNHYLLTYQSFPCKHLHTSCIMLHPSG